MSRPFRPIILKKALRGRGVQIVNHGADRNVGGRGGQRSPERPRRDADAEILAFELGVRDRHVGEGGGRPIVEADGSFDHQQQEDRLAARMIDARRRRLTIVPDIQT